MDKSYLNRGIICVLVGICFILAAVFTESALDGLLWGLAGGALGPGIGMIIMHFYWSSPQNIEFAILGKMGVITDYKIVVLYLYGLMVFQIAAGVAANWYLRQKY